MKISELEGKAVAIWGYGREGRAALAALRWRLPRQSITVFCSDAEAETLRAMEDPNLVIATEVDGEKLAAFEVVIKSPGISPYTSPAVDAALHGTQFIGGTALWFAENPFERTVCVTGTKGKSTVTALIAHLLRSAGRRTALAGNIGLPLLELLDVEPAPQYWAIELSSYQAGEAVNPEVAVVLNFYPEHLDWHGTEQRYFDDKMALLTKSSPRVAVLNAGDQRLAEAQLPPSLRVIWFNDEDGWHLRDSKVIATAGEVSGDLELREVVSSAVGVHWFRDLHREIRDAADGRYRRIAILVGGYDRGVDWGVFAERMVLDPPRAVITMGQNGPRIHERLKQIAVNKHFALAEATEMEDALRLGREILESEGVILLSPGAPSFPRYSDYVDRGRHFAKLAGFDPKQISSIPGLGVS
ncbi:MAG: Mur ligase family protein [Gammaproteobacteria bacterium]|nr:Mur ligase family protein [Gammaproteobacteria bacterium]